MMGRWIDAIALVLVTAPAGCYAGLGADAPTDGETEATGGTNGTASASGPSGGPGSGPSSTGSTLSAGSESNDTSGGSGETDEPSTGGSGDEESGSSSGGGPSDVERVCNRWTSDRVELGEGNWSGNVGACDPGDVSADGRANALRLVNLYRWMVELPEVATDPGRDAMAQECALMMHANGALSHDPPMGWTCYSADGATAAGSSNISGGPGVMSVDLYMVDPGNSTTLGHRRWILSNSAGPIGLGSTSDYSCMWVLGGEGGGNNEWTAWPPPGPFPFEAVSPGFSSLDATGWSVQSDSIDLSGANATITVDGEARPVTVTNLAGGYGSSWAISMVPNGWMAQPETTYHVRVDGIGGGPIEYDVQIVDCG